jgi:hypothetical protein
MGAHHFKFHLVPIGDTVVRNSAGERTGWLLINHTVSQDVVNKLRGLRPKMDRWGEVEEYVSLDDWGSDIRVFRENGKVADIGIRYAPNCDPVDLLRQFVEVAKEAGCDVLIDSTREIVPAEFEVVFAALRKHRAFRFLSDPKGAIIEAANETKQRGPEPG